MTRPTVHSALRWLLPAPGRRRETKSLLVQRIVAGRIRESAPRYLSGRMIDIGCSAKPYAELLRPHLTRHVGIDHRESPHDLGAADAVASAYSIPFRDGSFDSALCTAVLEHLEEPEHALRECLRLLVPGGHAVYTVPFIWHVHEEPRDFFRFSKHGLRYLFEKVGFEVVRIDALSGFWTTFFQLLTYNLDRLNRGPLRSLGLLDGPELALQALGYGLDRIDRTEQWTWMYLVVARRP